MKERIGICIVLLLALFTFLPPLFTEGNIFSVEGVVEDLNGNMVRVKDLYYGNVYFSLFFFLISFLAIALPFILPKMTKTFARISTMFGVWYFMGTLYEVFNLKIPSIVLNSSGDNALYVKFVLAFTLGILIIMIRDIWTNTKKLQK